jgi:hypothetical protein
MHYGSLIPRLAYVSLLASAPAWAGTLPKQVVVDAHLESGGGTLRLHGKSTSLRTSMEVEVEDFTAPESGQYTLVLVGSTETREVGRFTVDDTGAADLHFPFAEDWRTFLLGVHQMQLLDGDAVVSDASVVGAGALRIQARLTAVGSSPKATYGVEGGVERRRDGDARFRFEARCEHATPGALTFRLSGPNGTYDIPVTVRDDGHGRARVEGTDDLLAAATQWTELIVLSGATEITRGPLVCR